MAGGVAKTSGVLAIVLGSLLLLGGLGAAGYGYLDEQENQERMFSDPERSEQNELLALWGLTGAAVGMGLLVLGLVLAGIGGARSRQELLAAARGEEPRRAPVTALLVVFGVVAALLLVWVVATGDEGISSFQRTGGPAPAFEPYSASGSTGPGADLVLASWAPAAQPVAFAMPEGSVRSDVAVSFDGALRIVFEARQAVGWTEMARHEGDGPALFVYEGAATDLRVRAFPSGPGPSTGTDFTVDATFL